jgi:hypothetical protein
MENDIFTKYSGILTDYPLLSLMSLLERLYFFPRLAVAEPESHIVGAVQYSEAASALSLALAVPAQILMLMSLLKKSKYRHQIR